MQSRRLQAPRTISLTYHVVTQDSPRAQGLVKFLLNFRDIEEAIRPFNGTDGYPVENWLQDFEENAAVGMVRSSEIIIEEMFNRFSEIIYAGRTRNRDAGKMKIFAFERIFIKNQ